MFQLMLNKLYLIYSQMQQHMAELRVCVCVSVSVVCVLDTEGGEYHRME